MELLGELVGYAELVARPLRTAEAEAFTGATVFGSLEWGPAVQPRHFLPVWFRG